jgi:sialic acid synthase SpsE
MAGQIVTRDAPKARYQAVNTGRGESQHDMLKRLELSRDETRRLFGYCRKKKILFMSTPYDEMSADFLDAIGMKIFKISSGELTNKPLIQKISSKGKPIILSTGMSYMDEVAKAVRWISESRKEPGMTDGLTLLHCVSSYPARPGEMNLSAMGSLRKRFKVPVGLSDHTAGTEISIAAVAMGAKVIEKHVTLDRKMRGPDHRASIVPAALEAMVAAIRNVEDALGDGPKRPSVSELAMRHSVRKGLVAARAIRAGQVIVRRDITAKRPCAGLAPEAMQRILDKKAAVDIRRDAPLRSEYFI